MQEAVGDTSVEVRLLHKVIHTRCMMVVMDQGAAYAECSTFPKTIMSTEHLAHQMKASQPRRSHRVTACAKASSKHVCVCVCVHDALTRSSWIGQKATSTCCPVTFLTACSNTTYIIHAVNNQHGWLCEQHTHSSTAVAFMLLPPPKRVRYPRRRPLSFASDAESASGRIPEPSAESSADIVFVELLLLISTKVHLTFSILHDQAKIRQTTAF